jgi:hypothetical protein
MKKTKSKISPAFRDMKQEELYEYRGGLCFVPVWLGQKLGEKLFDLFRQS